MGVFRALGIGIFLITLEMVMPPVFKQFESTSVAFLHGVEVSADSAASLAAAADASHLLRPSSSPILPKARMISGSY